ncbi:phage tail tape measure C-terminal domain-containing protein [Algiphilus sp.]|uniref:phage tail tape measure C-terminal domain-containing protein n=1 Tax=Algiphilus sp. TaxID=1872431 RepID=UPI003CCC2F8A
MIAGLTAGGFIAITARSLEAQDAVGKLAERLGASVEELSGLQFVAEQTGVKVETLNMGLQRMVRRISEAAQGSGEAKGAIEELGLSATRLNQMRPAEQFRAIADEIAGIENPADRVRIAMRLFDSEGVALVQTLQKGSGEIVRMQEEARKLGRVITQDQAKAAAEARDAMNRLRSAGSGLSNVLAIELAPTITALANGLSEQLSESFNDSSHRAVDWGETVGNIVATVADGVTLAFRGVATGAEAFISTLGASAAQVMALLRGEVELARQIGSEWWSDQTDMWSDLADLDAMTRYRDALREIREELEKSKDEPQGGGGGGGGTEIEAPSGSAEPPTTDIFGLQHMREFLAFSADMAEAERTRRQAVEDVSAALETQAESARRSYQERLKLINANVKDEARRAELLRRNERQLTEDLQRLNDDRQKGLEDQLRRLEFAANDVFQNMEDAIVQFAKTGELSVSNMVNAILSDLLRLSVQQAITQPLANAVVSGIGGAFSGGGQGAAASATGQSVADLGPIGSKSMDTGRTMKVEIINEGGSAEIKSARVERRPNGDEVARIVQRVMAEDADNNGPGSRAIARNFGLTRRPA